MGTVGGIAARRRWRVAAALLLAVAALGMPASGAVTPASAADDDLRLTVATTYSVEPDDAVVRVRLDVEATNLAESRVTGATITRYYYDAIELPIQGEAANVRASQGGTRLRVTASEEDGFQRVVVRLARRLFYQQTARLAVTFDLPGGPPRSSSPIRVGRAYATFYAWAWGDPGRASVRIAIPVGFDIERTGERLDRAIDGDRTILTDEAIDDPEAWYTVLDARRPSQLTADRLDLEGGQRVTVHAWPEDEEWRAEVTSLMRRGLPVLERLIGLPWPVEGELTVFEVHTPVLEGYAGIYYTDRDEIEIGEDLDSLTILHEASHAWFNDALWTGRWISEGFADAYAARAGAALDESPGRPERIDRRDPGFVELNDWTFPGSIDDEATDARETFGYNASWWLVDALVREIGEDGMRAVLAAAEARQIAYVGAPEPETQGGAANWRRFLDLLEEIGGSDQATELFRAWVVAPSQQHWLDDRAEARAAYAQLLEHADGWDAPYAVRSRLAYWEFHRVREAIEEADALLDLRDELHADAEALSLDPSHRLEAAWEGATSSLDEARELVEQQRDSLDAIEAATAALAAPRDGLVSLGLWGGPEPEQDLADAGVAWEADQHGTARLEAASVRAILVSAAEVGRTRALLAVAAVWVVLSGLLALLLLRRRRLRRAAAAAAALTAAPPSAAALTASAPGDPASADGTYATLAADPGDPPEPGTSVPDSFATGWRDPS